MSIVDSLKEAIETQSWDKVIEVYKILGGSPTDEKSSQNKKRRPKQSKSRDTDDDGPVLSNSIVTIDGEEKTVSEKVSPTGKRKMQFITFDNEIKVKEKWKKVARRKSRGPSRPKQTVSVSCIICQKMYDNINQSIIPDNGFVCNQCLSRGKRR